MRILHFSDFHLNRDNIDKAKQILDQMIIVLEDLQKEKRFDLIIFTGDMLECGGRGFSSISEGFKAFEEHVIKPLLEATRLDKSRFIFTPGNHDIDRDADDEETQFEGIEKRCSSVEGIVEFIQDRNVGKRTSRVDAVKEFERQYYDGLPGLQYKHNRFNSTFELDIDGIKVGIVSMNTVWRCSDRDKHAIAMGINQINENGDVLKGKELALGITHYPIALIKEVEREDVRKLSARELDVYLCGHTHGGGVNFQAPYKEYAFLEINSAGSLAGNIYESHKDYQNGFQVIDCDNFAEGKGPQHYVLRKYIQNLYKTFELEGREEERFYPDPNQLKALHQEYLQRITSENQEKQRLSILPFTTLEEYIKGAGRGIVESEFISSEKIDIVKEAIRTEPSAVRLMALSGMGKTRIVIEAFRGMPDVFYTNVSDCFSGLKELISSWTPKVVIVDNCDKAHLDRIVKDINESGCNLKLVTVHNVLTTMEQSTDGKVYRLTYDDTEEIIDKMIARESFLEQLPRVAQAIKERSGRIPYMALLLLRAYKKNKTLKLEEPETILSTLLSGTEALDLDKLKAMKSLALFSPLGYEGSLKEEYEFVVKSKRVHHINLDPQIVKNAFRDTVTDFEFRQLIERFGDCIRVRPQPLAEWLTELWLREFSTDFPEIIKEISLLEPSLSNRLLRALDRRFRGMGDSPYAKELFDALNDCETGAFHNEELVLSSAGSQLLLSMGLVSPVAVSKSIWFLLERRSIEWLKQEFGGDARRRLVWALENLCMPASAFRYAALSLAKLAVAENEDIGNNATAQFLQLFHLYLSGTEATLDERVTLLQELREIPEYQMLVVKAIDHALKARDFTRLDTSSAHRLDERMPDYQPSYNETTQYWTNCLQLLQGVSTQNEMLWQAGQELLPKHVSDFNHMGLMPQLYQLIEFYGTRSGYDWEEMREQLSMCYHHWFRGSDTEKEVLRSWLDKLYPKTFYGRMKALTKEKYHSIDYRDYLQCEEELTKLMALLAEEFLREEVYETDELSRMMDSDDYIHHSFFSAVGSVAREEGQVASLLIAMLRVVHTKEKDYESPFVNSLSRFLSLEAVLDFTEQLFEGGYVCMACAVEGAVDSESHGRLKPVIKLIELLPERSKYINSYLRRYPHNHPLKVLDIFGILVDSGFDKNTVCYPYLVRNLEYQHLAEITEAGKLAEYQETLLAYDYAEEYAYIGRTVVRCIQQILEEEDCPEFAFKVHRKVIDTLNKAYLIENPLKDIYNILLPRYQDAILTDLLDTIANAERYAVFYFQLYLDLGSGFGTGSGPLFQCDENMLRQKCLEHPSTLPISMARMCPIYNFADGATTGFSEFFLWLCDSFGDNVDVLNEFDANMGTMTYLGGERLVALSKRLTYLEELNKHPRSAVREWAQVKFKQTKIDLEREQKRGEYEQITR